MEYKILAFYLFTPVADPKKEVTDHKNFLQNLDATARIYISEEGINGQMSIHERDYEKYLQWLKNHPLWKDLQIKIHYWTEHVFAKLSVKYRPQIVALDQKVDPKNTGEKLSPKEWAKRLEQKDENTIIIDVRNDYESDVGYFEGALKPPIKTFREFPDYAKNLARQYDPKTTKVMMYCTGGIRCELYSALMKDYGFSHVSQLDGGVIQYGLEQGNKHWKGKLFVFDDRLVVPISDDPHEPVSHCKFCDEAVDLYFNCANMDCNDLFIACENCIQKTKGCCSDKCLQTGRIRAFTLQKHPKPFRKLHKGSA